MKTNWKTNLAGVAVLVLLVLYLSDVISTEQFVTATAFLVSIGLFSAEDTKDSKIGLPKPKNITALDSESEDAIGLPKPKLK